MLGEEKMLGSNRKGATSPASKKSSPETGKVRDGAAHPRDMGRGLLATWGALRLHFLAFLRLEAPSVQLVPPKGSHPPMVVCPSCRPAQRSPSGPSLPCSSSRRRSGSSCRRSGRTCRRAS